MNKSMKRITFLLVCIVIISTMLAGCSDKSKETSQENKSKKMPEINISWGHNLHTSMLEIPISKVDEFKEKGTYLNEISEDKYELIENDKKLAIVNYVPNKGASEVANLMGQGHVDAGICSNVAILSAIDKGSNIKILAPVQTGAIGLVFQPDKDFDGWEDLKEYIISSKEPVKIGYHSSASGPRILLEHVLKEEKIEVTENPNEHDADVLLVDLKGTNNLIPSLSGNQVDGWVGPSHFPEIAESEGAGRVVLELKDFPPAGKWDNFPCCVFSVTEDELDKHPEAYEAMVGLIDESCKYYTENEEESAKILSEAIGIEEDIVKSAKISYTTDPTEEWLDGINIYVDALNDMDKFDGELKEKPFGDVKDRVFDFSYIEKIGE